MTLNCPVHVHWVMRYEYSHANGPTMFCLNCCKHYPLCTSTAGTWACSNFRDHDGEHAHKVDGRTVLVWPNKKPDAKAEA